LATAVYWFSQISYRLLFNKKRTNGGLLSVVELRIWCQFFGITSIIQCGWGIYRGQWWLVAAGAFMAFACLNGLRLATARATGEKAWIDETNR
jgi:hypothetical protein